MKADTPHPERVPLTPGEFMGLGVLLRAWRASAGQRTGLGRALTQEEVAYAIGRSVRWYGDLEGGATPRLERALLDALADVLHLRRDERQALMLHALGGALPTTHAPHGDTPARQQLQVLLDQQMPQPAYLSDRNWNILAHNAPMADWWPWIVEPGANLARFALLSPDARHQLVDWPRHAIQYIGRLRFAAVENPKDPCLAQLISDVLQDPDCRRIWDDPSDVYENLDGNHYLVRHPKHDNNVIELVTSLLYPASLPGSRLVVIRWTHHDPPEPRATQTQPPTALRSVEHAAHTGQADHRQPSRRLHLQHAEDILTAAGTNPVPLPALSELVGENCTLVIAPETRSVLWATRQEDGSWLVEEHDPNTVITRLPSAVPTPAAEAELRQLWRTALPADPAEAALQIRTLIHLFTHRTRALEVLWEDLQREHPGVLPDPDTPGCNSPEPRAGDDDGVR